MKLRFTNQQVHTYSEGKVTTVSYDCALMNGKSILRTFKVTGKTVRSKDDAQNADVARHIADSRAKEMAYNIACNGAHPVTLQHQKAELEANLSVINFLEKMLFLRRKERAHIKNVIDSTCK